MQIKQFTTTTTTTTTTIVNACKPDSYGSYLPTVWYLDGLKSRVQTSIKSAFQQMKQELQQATDYKL